MDIFFITFEAVFTLVGIGFIGFWILMRRLIPDSVIRVLTTLALNIAFPCLVFSSIMTGFDPSSHGNWYHMPLWWAAFTAGAFVLSVVSSFVIKWEVRPEFRISLLYHNAIFVPFGIISGVFGQDSVYITDLFLFALIYPAFFFNTYQFFFRRRDKKSAAQIRSDLFFNPILVATIFAMALKLTGGAVFVPEVLIKITTVISGMALPLIILIIGGSIYIDLQKREPFRFRETFYFVLIKNFVFPAVALGLIALIRPAENAALILTLAAAAPPITAVPIVAEKAGGNRGFANQMLAASFITALISVPVVMIFFRMLY